jgi:hypothetical protein
MTREELIARVQEDGVRFVSLQFTDILGTVKSVTIPATQLEEALENGVWFDGSSIEGFARIYESDRLLVPDPCHLPGAPLERARAAPRPPLLRRLRPGREAVPQRSPLHPQADGFSGRREGIHLQRRAGDRVLPLPAQQRLRPSPRPPRRRRVL